MDDTNFDTRPARRGEVTGVVRRRRWSDGEKGRIVAEAVAPGAVIADVARRNELAPQHLSNWIRAAKAGRLVLPGDRLPAFVPVIAAETVSQKGGARADCASIEIVLGTVKVRVRADAQGRDIETVLRAVRRSGA
jgi:transposase